MPEPIRGPRYLPGKWARCEADPMPGRVSNELPAYLHVLINHKMSPRGSIKLSISLSFLPLLPLTHGSPPTFLYHLGRTHSHSPLPSASVK